MYQISTWSTKYCKRTIEKVWRSKMEKKFVVILCRVSGSGTRQRSGLPSAYPLALGKPGRQAAAITWRRFLPSARVCRVPDTRQKGPLPSVWLCQVPDSRQSLLCRVYIVAECGTRQNSSSPSARLLALGKESCTRQRPCSHSVL